MPKDEIMMAVVKEPDVTCLALKDEKNADGNIVKRTVESKAKTIDILRLRKFCYGVVDFGNSTDWANKLQLFAQLLTIGVGKDLNSAKATLDSISRSYAMDATLLAMQNGKTPTSKTAMLKKLCELFSAMFGDQIAKPRSQDVVYLNLIGSKKGKGALTVKMVQPSELGKAIIEIAHGMDADATNGAMYTIDFPAIKTK